MGFRGLTLRKCTSILLAYSFVAVCIRTYAQTAVKQGIGHRSQTGRTVPDVFEDDEVRIPIPNGWTVSSGDHPAVDPYGNGAAGNSVDNAKGKLLLRKGRYTLAIAYDTEHASGVTGGRFIEALTIPWLDPMEAWECNGSFTAIPQPASRMLIFQNLIFR